MKLCPQCNRKSLNSATICECGYSFDDNSGTANRQLQTKPPTGEQSDCTSNPGGFKNFPLCRQQIRQEAVKCRFCGEWVEDGKHSVPDTASKGNIPETTFNWCAANGSSLCCPKIKLPSRQKANCWNSCRSSSRNFWASFRSSAELFHTLYGTPSSTQVALLQTFPSLQTEKFHRSIIRFNGKYSSSHWCVNGSFESPERCKSG